jgi:hypothetical protein
MKSALYWWGRLSLPLAGHPVLTEEMFLLDVRYLYKEKQKLIEALEDWLWAEERRTKICDNPKCPEYL